MVQSNMENLIERLEKATGPDRELDARIWCAKLMDGGRVGGVEFVKMQNEHRFLYRPFDGMHGAWGKTFERKDFYTASIDAAMTLVPEGTEVELYCAVPLDIRCAVVLDRPNSEARVCQAATPPLALCIAALKARSTLTRA